MNKKQDQNHPVIDNKDVKTTKKSARTKWATMVACVCGGLLLGAGGTFGVMATHGGHHHDGGRIEAALHSKKKASVKDIKIDQQAAIDKFNEKYANKQISEVKLEDDRGQYVYEVKGFDDTKEYEVEVNAKTGKVISSKSEKLDADEKPTALDTSKTISRDDASKVAKDAAKKGSATEWELKEENGKAVWEVKVVNGHQVKEVTLDANSKKVLSTEIDH